MPSDGLDLPSENVCDSKALIRKMYQGSIHMNAKIEAVTKQIGQVIKGKDDIIYKLLAAIIAGGHILLEDIPGVGKTTLAVTVSRTMSLKYKRMQFTLSGSIFLRAIYSPDTISGRSSVSMVFCPCAVSAPVIASENGTSA